MKLGIHNFYVLFREKDLQETINFHQYVKIQLFFAVGKDSLKTNCILFGAKCILY